MKRKNTNQQLPSFEETVELMQYKGLLYVDYEVLNVLFSNDKQHRFVIVKSNKGFLSYNFETLFYDEDLFYIAGDTLPAYWSPSSSKIKPVFGDIEALMREVKSTPEYKSYFDNNCDG